VHATRPEPGGTAPLAGTCFGFDVRSPLAFRYLRAGGGTDEIEVTTTAGEPDDPGELILEWKATDEFPLAYRLHRSGREYRLWMADSGWFAAAPDRGRITVPETPNAVRREERLWGIPAMLSFFARGDLALHAAAVEVDGRALLLAAPRTFGKTTLAAAFHAAGYRLLAEDTSCLRLDAAGIRVVPGPAMLRLRLDVADALRLPDVEAVGAPDDRVHYAVRPERRGDCTPVPLAGVVVLRGDAPETRLAATPEVDAVRDLWSLSWHLPTPDDRARAFTGVADLTRQVPVWDLERPVRIEELSATVNVLVDRLQR
jgi:hypothetical protein